VTRSLKVDMPATPPVGMRSFFNNRAISEFAWIRDRQSGLAAVYHVRQSLFGINLVHGGWGFFLAVKGQTVLYRSHDEFHAIEQALNDRAYRLVGILNKRRQSHSEQRGTGDR
jgi:hypothetical protein